jgi:methionine-S-sulfoxide reductase
VVRTRVGYAGGTKEDPNYQNLGDHTESIQVDFDPSVIAYDTLLKVFWDSHAPNSKTWSVQYMPILFYHDEAQKKLAEASKERVAQTTKKEAHTEIRPAGTFYRAEDYHQKYRLRARKELMRELKAMLPTEKAFTDSTAAARINGYLGGYGTADDLLKELPGFGLSPEAGRRLADIVKKRQGTPACPF